MLESAPVPFPKHHTTQFCLTSMAHQEPKLVSTASQGLLGFSDLDRSSLNLIGLCLANKSVVYGTRMSVLLLSR